VSVYLGKSVTFTQNYATANPDGIWNSPRFEAYDISFITKLNYTSWTVAPLLNAFNLVGIYNLQVTLLIEYYGDWQYIPYYHVINILNHAPVFDTPLSPMIFNVAYNTT
jgi:hypothetical protein